MAYNPREDDKEYFLTGLLDTVENGVIGSVNWLQKQAEDNPDTWTDDAFRLVGGGLKNSAWALSKIPGLKQLGQAEEFLVDRARDLNENLTPWLDPRVAGWGTRIATGMIADKGIGKAFKGVKGLDKTWRINQLQKGKGRFGQVLKPLDARPTPSQEIGDWGLQMMADIDGNLEEFKHLQKLPEKAPLKVKPFKPTPQKRWESIYENKPKYRYPSIEDLDLATSGPGYEVKGWIYVRPSTRGGTSRSKWDQITRRLQKKFGGTEDQRQAFINQQRAAWKNTQNDIRQLNERFQFNYLEFARLGLEELTENAVLDLTKADETLFQIYLTMASRPKKYPIFELGHIRSAKNIARETKEGIATSADYVSNLRAEIRRSIRDFTKYDAKTKRYKLIEAGNQTRKAHMDAPKIVNLLLGTSPNVETEWLRHIGDFGYALENIVPFEKQDHFMEFLRKGIRRWQNSEPGGLSGPYQLRFYRRELNKLIDDYLNMLDEGMFLDDAAKSDFIDQALIDRRSGLEAQRASEAGGRTVFRKTMPRFRGDERGAK